ncbi:MAG: globin [Candidatus Dormibacteraeota bacterium]|nr:globin [Candidatus Dormibacteraeota bacterium]
MKSDADSSLFDRVGGEAWFVALVDRFYHLVEDDPVLRPLYPEDLSGPRQHLAGFLAQRWGGPSKYSEARGHPRLRMRHAPFAIGQAERDVWFQHMSAALAAGQLDDADRAELRAFFDSTSTMLINREEP